MSEENKNDQVAPEAPQASEQQAAPQPPAAAPVPPQQPPMGQPQPQPQAQPPYVPQPVYPPAPLMQLTGGMKFGWLVVGALLGIPGIIIAWLANADKVAQVKSDALKFSIIGFVIWIVLGLLLSLMIGGMVTALVAGAMGSAGYYGYDYHGSW